ncbi:MAG: ZIP family metal transporter, partial [Butyrivibrio sp.]|nr:ZIP family metal transporter [Butyrivibrio sp.]
MFQIILIPFLGTALGAATVFFFKKAIGEKMQRALTGFASGVMVAASFFSLLLPALDQTTDMGKMGFVPVSIGFGIGMLFLLVLDVVTPHMHLDKLEEGPRSGL